MNKVVREHYPVSSLPEELRGDLNPAAMVTVTIREEERPPEKIMSLDEIFSLEGFQRRSIEEIVADVRKMRDEWDG